MLKGEMLEFTHNAHATHETMRRNLSFFSAISSFVSFTWSVACSISKAWGDFKCRRFWKITCRNNPGNLGIQIDISNTNTRVEGNLRKHTVVLSWWKRKLLLRIFGYFGWRLFICVYKSGNFICQTCEIFIFFNTKNEHTRGGGKWKNWWKIQNISIRDSKRFFIKSN